MTEALRHENTRKYSSTNDTPLMREGYISSLGYLGELEDTTKVLDGTYIFPHSASDYEGRMFAYLKRPDNIQDLPIIVADGEYKQAWRTVKERRVPSFSGRYFSVYKAVTEHPALLSTFAAAYNIPFLNGLSYPRWSNMLDVMTFKEEGVRHVDRLRTLVLGEGD